MFQKPISKTLSKTNHQNPENKPCLVAANEAEQGFSVSYKGKFLYSKYNPQKAIVNTIENLEVLDDTAFLCFSPVLGYGLPQLLEKINSAGDNSAIFLIEKDEELFEIMKESAQKDEKIFLLKPKEADFLPNYLWENPKKFKRVVPLNMSAGTQFFADDYAMIFQKCQNVVSSFWKNRVTLVKLGRLFSKNLFKNLKLMGGEKTVEIENYFGTIGSEILVCGAGPSLNETLENIEESSTRPVIVAVDAALPVLKSYGIKPDFVVALESQLAIEKCYIGLDGDFFSDTVFISDLTSRPQLNRMFAKFGLLAFFSTAYTESLFYKNLKKEGILPWQVTALGSVGLSAVAIALKLRKNENVNVFVSGLDFSYNINGTHAKGSVQQKTKLMKSWRGASWETVGNVNLGNGLYSDTSLLGYAENFKNEFSKTKNLFNAGKIGVDLGIERKLLNFAQNSRVANDNDFPFGKQHEASHEKDAIIKAYLKKEKAALNEIKKILTGESTSEGDTTERLQSLIEMREYLFLHFPDGHKCDSSNLSFLKRVRTEIDWFLKIIG